MLSQFRKTRFSCFHAFAFIFLLTSIFSFYTSNAYSAQVKLAWDPPENEQDIIGYKVHYGNSSGNYDTSIDVGNQTSYTITGLESGKTYYFVVTSYNIYGNESSYSIEVSYNVPSGDPGASSSFDDFSTDTTGDYTFTDTWTLGGFGSFLYDSVGQRARVLTGDNVGLQFSHILSPLDTGTFSIDFLPTVKYPAGGIFTLILRQDANNYYLLRNTDGYGPSYLRKYVGGTLVDSANFLSEYSQNNNYSITIDFSPGQTTVNAFGEALTINTDSSSITVNSFEIETRQQDANFDNISYTGSGSGNLPPANQEPDGVIDTPVGDQIITVGNLVSFMGTGTDPEPDLLLTYLWNFGAGSGIADSTLESPGLTQFNNAGVFTVTFTVTDGLGLADSTPATVQIKVISGASSSFDDFSTNTTGDYTVTNTWTAGGFGSFLYDSAGQRAQVLTGDNVGLQFSHSLSPLDTGTFSIDFLPTAKYPLGGIFQLILRQDANNYYLLRNTDGYGPSYLRKYVGGTLVDSANFTIEYSQNNNYSITVNFSPGQTTVNAFGESLTINTDSSNIMVNSFEIDTRQQDAYFDNITYTD